MEKTYHFLSYVLMFLFSVTYFISRQWQSGIKEADVSTTPPLPHKCIPPPPDTHTQLVLSSHIQVLTAACYPFAALCTLASPVSKQCSYLSQTLTWHYEKSFMLSLIWAQKFRPSSLLLLCISSNLSCGQSLLPDYKSTQLCISINMNE